MKKIKVFETSLTSIDPIKDLLGEAKKCMNKGNIAGLYEIDVMLSDKYIQYLRVGTKDDLTNFVNHLLAFLDSEVGDKLKFSEEGKKYYYRWDHFHDLCNIAIENYDYSFTARFIASRKQGDQLMSLLLKHSEGIGHNKLAIKLNVSREFLLDMVREFQEHGLVISERKNQIFKIRLGLVGRIYMSEK
jgi:hypothetical protein